MSESSARRHDRMRVSRPVPPLTQMSLSWQMLLAGLLAAASVGFVHILPAAGLHHDAAYVGLDLLLALPVAGLAVAMATSARLGRWFGTGAASRVGALAVGYTVLFVPLMMAQSLAHAVVGGSASPGASVTSLLSHSLLAAVLVWPAVLIAALLGLAAYRQVAGRGRRRLWRAVLAARRPLTAVGAAGAVLATMGAAAALPASPAVAQASSCASAPQRVYDVAAINVEITVNRHGDSDPFGFMYVLQDNVTELRQFEQRLRVASAIEDIVDEEGNIVVPWAEQVANDPQAELVSPGLRQDLIQPLVIRARLGECVVINLRNDLTRPAVSGPNNANLFQIPGGVPSVSIDMQGVSYDAASGDGGQQAGNNAASMVAPGQTGQFRFFLDPLMGEGTKLFQSGGDSSYLTAHGLFGALIAEPAGSRWFDPNTGQDRTDDAGWSNWEAMIQVPDGITFREFTILYHEIGDEDFNLRRPLREPFGGGAAPDPFDDSPQPRLVGGTLPMIDAATGNVAAPFNTGGATTAYRPGSRALNYRSESFFRRLQHETLLVAQAGGSSAEAAVEQKNNKSLGYSSYTYGDPATPIPRSYLGEPTKTRLAHVGFEQLHVHHLHGGATRWRQNPGADDTRLDSGLDKFPLQNAQSIRLDSQTISPLEAFSLEHECGAGGCQQAAGDFLYHCHIAHHYVAGMWSFWRVFDTVQEDLAPLPGRAAPAAGVTSAELIGTVLPDGRTIVPEAEVTDPQQQVGINTWVESQLPPQGQRLDKNDATVWDWDVTGPASAPVYLREPDSEQVWENYRSETPGARHPIRFNPTNGRPAFPLLQPHLGQRPPFSPNEHSGAPWLGDTADAGRPDGLCPASADVRRYDITAVSVDDRHPDGGIRMTAREVDNGGMLFVLNQDKEDLLTGQRPTEPLVIRSNVGDCVAITFGNEIDNPRRLANGHSELAKTNMHTHFVQFDPLASDGVITGLSYEQSVFPAQLEGRTLVSVDGPSTITVNHVNRLRPGIAIAIGLGTPEIEIRTIIAINGNQLTFDRPLDNSHSAGVWVSVEFTQHRWYSDVDSGTVFWHDHVDGIISWAHGLFAAHVIEPAGSTYHDPVTGAQVDSGTIVDIRNNNPNASVGVGQSGSFREFVIFLHNGRPAASNDNNRKFGQECEEGSINLRAAPFGERTPSGTLITDGNGVPVNVDPATTDQRFEFNGGRCRNAYTRDGDPTNQNAGTVEATVTTVDPYVFSSVKYGEPQTPLLRAYVGDDVVIRTIGLGERAEGLRFQGHRFRMERFNPDGQLMDAAVSGISERFDYVLDGGAGGPLGIAGDYLYHSTRTFALESGAWGIFRVHDTVQGDLQPLPDNAVGSGAGFPILAPHEAGNPQQNPGPNPPAASSGNVSDDRNVCQPGQIPRIYSITVFDHPLPTSPFPDTEGVVFALTSDVAAIQNGTKQLEPLVLRVNQGDCVIIRLRNRIQSDQVGSPAAGSGSLYGGSRAGLDLGMLLRNQQLSGGVPVGLNPDTTVAAGQNGEYRFRADVELGTTLFTNLGSPASLRHGGYGMLIVEPAGSQWFDSRTGARLGATATSTEAIINPPDAPAFREFAVTMHTTDQHYSRSIVEYVDVVAGNGINAPRAVNRPSPLVPGAPPGTAETEGTFNKGYNHVNYRTEPLTAREGLTDAPGPGQNPNWWQPGFQLAHPFGTAFSSTVHGDPDTPVFVAHSGDRVVFRVGIGASDQAHSFSISGHMFPLEPQMWDGASDRRSQLMLARTIAGGQTLDAWLVGGAGATAGNTGDYVYRDARQPWTAAGVWGLLRVVNPGSGGIAALP